MSAGVAERIYDEVFTRIRCGAYSSRIPTEKELAAEFGANVKTVAKALQTLAGEGVIERRRRRGTFVRGRPDAPTRPALNMLALPDSAFEETNPGRYRVYRFLHLLWEEAGRRHIPVHLLPASAESKGFDRDVNPNSAGNYAVVFGGRPVRVFEALLAAGYRPIGIGEDREYYPALRALPYVAIDGRIELGYADLVAHLKARGRRRIGIVWFEYGKDKAKILADALAEHQLAFDPRLSVVAGRQECGQAVRELLASGVAVDAILFNDNEAARAGIEELQKAGKRVPEDVAVACYSGDVDGPSYNAHTMTHMALDMEGYVREAVAIVAANRYRPGTIYRPSRLVEGTTT